MRQSAPAAPAPIYAVIEPSGRVAVADVDLRRVIQRAEAWDRISEYLPSGPLMTREEAEKVRPLGAETPTKP